MKRHSPNLPVHQQGAVLFIALIVLLLVTILAVTSMRGVVLEARITANLLEHKRLISAAESALRQSEKRIIWYGRPLDICQPNSTEVTCIQNLPVSYIPDFSTATLYSDIDTNAELERNAYWYIQDTGIISSTEPECFLTGKNCVSYYEVNSQATKGVLLETCEPEALCLRSVVATIYD